MNPPGKPQKIIRGKFESKNSGKSRRMGEPFGSHFAGNFEATGEISLQRGTK